MRYAVYFTPPREDPLARAAAVWLGRDPFGGEPAGRLQAAGLSEAELAFHTAAARRYGFHATLKAPFRLRPGATERGLISAVSAFAARMRPFAVPRIVPKRLDGFLALVPFEECRELNRFAGDVVTAFERFRAPLDDAEIARRNPDRLSPTELKNLHLWGYPYVFETFRFHMTLTGRLSDQEAPRLERAVAEHFGPLLDEPLEIGSVALFTEPEPGAPFSIRSFHMLGRAEARQTA